ncbi:VSP [Giardia lamblia P15]|uniref:VSP n=1 Tax=Giardia intestinalis (strain P15) TaxID=658858 RepID=E1EXQ8_GIAIA|nr:VSP [Giardia lamblia P15]
MLLVAIYLSLGVLAANCSGSTAAANCEAESCETVNNIQICTQCVAGYVPIDGKCVGFATANNCKTAANAAVGAGDKTCGQCTGASFLYMGGCYAVGADGLGKTLCKRAADGACKEGADGYFALLGATPTELSILPCNETTETTLAGDKKYKGVKYCATCTAPEAASGGEIKIATCQTCTDKSKPKDNVCPSPENPNINKNSLPPGAIAGIAVAVVIVVGGLVGFLCWWFICRGKA